MKRFFTFLLLIVCSISAYSLTYIYRGNSNYLSDIVYTFDGKYLYRGKSTYMSDILYTYVNGKVYEGRSTYSTNLIWMQEGNNFYRCEYGNKYYEYRIENQYNGKHLRSIRHHSTILMVKNGKVYWGTEPYLSKIVYNYKGYLPEVFLLLL